MATPSDVVVLKSSHTTTVHVISSLANNPNLTGTQTNAHTAKFCTKQSQKNSVPSSAQEICSKKHSDSFQNLFGIDGYLARRQGSKGQTVDNNNFPTSYCESESINEERSSSDSICLKCEAENTMNNNTKTSDQTLETYFKKGQEVCHEVSDALHCVLECDSTSKLDGNDRRDGKTEPNKDARDLGKHRNGLRVECPETEVCIYDEDACKHKQRELLRPFSLSGEDQKSHKQKVFGVTSIPLLGLSSKPKGNSSILLETTSGKLPEYPSVYTQPLLPKQSHDTKHTPYQQLLSKPHEISEQVMKKNSVSLLEEHSSVPRGHMPGSTEMNIFKTHSHRVKGNIFHPVDDGIQKMTLHHTQKIASFDSCTCINPGSSHACASRAPTYGILNPLFDDTLRYKFLDRNVHFDTWKSFQMSDKPWSSSFDPMDLCLPPLANAPNTQGTYYYLPYSLPTFPNASSNRKKSNSDSLVSLSSVDGKNYAVDSSGKAACKSNDKPLAELERKEGIDKVSRPTRLNDSRKDCSSKPKKKTANESTIPKDRSSFLSPASGEMNLPYTPPDIQEELMFPDTSYGKGTEIIQNLNAQENDFILGRPNRKPRSHDLCELVRDADGNISEVCTDGNKSFCDFSTRSIENLTLTDHKLTEVTTKEGPEQMTLEKNVMESIGDTYLPKNHGESSALDMAGVRPKKTHRLLDKRPSLPVNIPLKHGNFDRNDYVSYRNETRSPEITIPHCLRLNCLDPCKEGPCLNSIGKSNSISNFPSVSENPSEKVLQTVDKAPGQRRSSDSSIFAPAVIGKFNVSGKVEETYHSLDKREGKQDKFAYQSSGKKRRLLMPQRLTFQEDDELYTESNLKNIQEQMCESQKICTFSSTSTDLTDEKSDAREQKASSLDDQFRTCQFALHGTSCGALPRGEDSSKYKRQFSRIPDTNADLLAARSFKVNDCHQSSFSSDDGVAHSTASGSQESSDNSIDSRKSLSLLDRRRKAAKSKEKLKLKITDRSSSEEIKESCEFGINFLENVETEVVLEKQTDRKVPVDSPVQSVTSLVDDLTNYWLDSPSPNSLTPFPLLESPSDFSHGTKMHQISQCPEASGFTAKQDSTFSNPTPKNSETKHKKRSRAVPTKSSSLTVYENPVSMANCSPDADKTLTREIVKNIIEESKSRSKSSSISSNTDLQMEPSATTSEFQHCYKGEFETSQVPYKPLVPPSPLTPCGGFLGGSTPLLPEGNERTFAAAADLTAQRMEEETVGFSQQKVAKNWEERRVMQKTGCRESSGAISKRSAVPAVPSDQHQRHHNRRHGYSRHRHQHQQSRRPHHRKRHPSVSSSSDEISSSDTSSSSGSSSSSSSSSSDSSSSSSESSSDLEDIIHLRP